MLEKLIIPIGIIMLATTIADKYGYYLLRSLHLQSDQTKLIKTVARVSVLKATALLVGSILCFFYSLSFFSR